MSLSKMQVTNAGNNGVLDPALDTALRAHFGAQRTAPPFPAALWQRLIPHLEARETQHAPTASLAIATDTPPAPLAQPKQAA